MNYCGHVGYDDDIIYPHPSQALYKGLCCQECGA